MDDFDVILFHIGYTRTNNYSKKERFDEVIAKISRCSFCLRV